MSDIILHHYEGSLFSEKIRLLLGYLKLPWKSVVTAPIMPRPLLMPLTGGYRRTPNMQQGADVWCDSKIIAERLADIAGDTSLHTGFVSHRVAEWADSHLFRVVVSVTFQPRAVGATMSTMSSTQIEAFMKDRAELTKGAPIVTMAPDVAEAHLTHYLAELDGALKTTFLFGAKPQIADFSVYHCLWLVANNSDCGAAARGLSERLGVARPNGRLRSRQRSPNDGGRSACDRHEGAADADSEKVEPYCRTALRSVSRCRLRRRTTAARFRSAANW